MRIRKVKVADGKIMIIYEQKTKAGLIDEYSLSCSDQARPEFYEALKALAPHVVEMCELPEHYIDRIEVRGVTFSYSGEHDDMGATISAQMKLYDSHCNLNLNTPHKKEDAPDDRQALTSSCIHALGRLQKECERYIRGDRAQGQLFDVA